MNFSQCALSNVIISQEILKSWKQSHCIGQKRLCEEAHKIIVSIGKETKIHVLSVALQTWLYVYLLQDMLIEVAEMESQHWNCTIQSLTHGQVSKREY